MSTTRNSRPVEPLHPTAFTIRVQNRQRNFDAGPDLTLLASMERSCTRTIDVGCRGGGCGRCRIRVLQGEYESKRMSRAHVSECDEAAGFVLACRIFPCSDLTIEVDQFQVPGGARSNDNNNDEE